MKQQIRGTVIIMYHIVSSSTLSVKESSVPTQLPILRGREGNRGRVSEMVWGKRGEASLRVGRANQPQRDPTFEAPCGRSQESNSPYDSDPTTPFQILLAVAFYSQQEDFQESWPPLWTLVLGHIQLAPSKGEREETVNLPLPPTTVAEKVFQGWIFVGPLLTSSVTLGKSLYPSEPEFSLQ